MATSFTSNPNNSPPQGPAWASWMGIVAVVLGVLLTAAHGNEWMKQIVIARSTPAGDQVAAADCPRDELVEEGLSRAECRQMVANVRNLALSAPDWFPRFQTTLAVVGIIIAFISIVVGAALVNYRSWAPAAAVLTFGALAAVDVFGFIGAVNAGPILRDLYLWDILIWFYIHLMMTVGVVAGRHAQT
jgi:hypothetical protein